MPNDYCDNTVMEKIYGATNIAKWADMDNDSDATKIANRKTYAIDVASEEMDDVARAAGGYVIPLQTGAGATPTTVEHLTGVIAGLWLYESRGAQDYNRDGPGHGHAWRREWIERMKDQIRDGRIKLDAIKGN